MLSILFYLSNVYFSILVMERKLLATVEEVKVQVHFNTKLLQTIVKKLDNISSANLEEMEEDVGGLDVTFPLTSKTELMQADEALQSDENRKKTCKYLLLNMYICMYMYITNISEIVKSILYVQN